MRDHTQYIVDKVAELNPVHAKKLKKNLTSFDGNYYQLAGKFYDKYIASLKTEGKTLDYAIDCYLSMIADINIETVDFYRTGKYSSSTFDEVNKRVYSNPGIMEKYMHGLIMSQFLWKHHYNILLYFMENLLKFKKQTKKYLEIGAGHGLYLSKAVENFDKNTEFTVVDVSQTSVDLAKNIADGKINFIVKNIFDFEQDSKFDFITMGEVIEHVEDPVSLLNKIYDLLEDNGTLFITTPTNAPTIDHIYLFNSIDEVQELIKSTGFTIESEVYFPSEDVSKEKAEKFKISILYGAFLKKKASN